MVKLHSFESASPRATFTACNVTVHGVTVQTAAPACFAHRNGGGRRDSVAPRQSDLFANGWPRLAKLHHLPRPGGDGADVNRAPHNPPRPPATQRGADVS